METPSSFEIQKSLQQRFCPSTSSIPIFLLSPGELSQIIPVGFAIYTMRVIG